MDSQFFENSEALKRELLKFDECILKLLEVKGGFFKRFRYRKCVKAAKEFYVAYVKKCNEYDTYMDFFTPLCWHLVASGEGYEKAVEYLNEIKNEILLYLKNTMGKEMSLDVEEKADLRG